MNPEYRKYLSMSAHMEGMEAIVASMGYKHKVSDMELMCLCNFAELGCLALFSKLEGEAGEQAEAELQAHIAGIRKQFAKSGGDGVNRLSASTVAILRGKFFKYLVEPVNENG